jgi:hypothetical protein
VLVIVGQAKPLPSLKSSSSLFLFNYMESLIFV